MESGAVRVVGGAVLFALFALFALWVCRGTAPFVPPAEAKDPPADAVPLPLGKTAILGEFGSTYYLDGACIIPRTVEITVQRGVTILGINGASLDVQGGLKVHGTQDTWVTIHHVDFSPTSAPLRGLHLDMVDFYDCTFKHSDEQSLRGEITIENSCFQKNCVFDVRLTEGFLKIMTVEFGMPCSVRSIRQKENRKPIEFEVRSSWMKAIKFAGPAMANFRHSEIRGGLACSEVTQVLVDGCDISGMLSFRQNPTDSFKKLTLTKCNLFEGAKVVCIRASGPKTKKERVRLQKFYFGPKQGPGLAKKHDIEALIEDGSDLSDGNVTINWTKPKKRPHQLVNYSTLRDRAPRLR